MHHKVHAALLTIAKTWKQPKSPLIDEWIKIWCIYTTEYYSDTNGNKIGAFVDIWMDLKSVVQSEVSQKNKYWVNIQNMHVNTHICGIQQILNQLLNNFGQAFKKIKNTFSNYIRRKSLFCCKRIKKD